MKIVVALGGNALLQRGQEMTAENQMANIRKAAKSLARLAEEHDIVLAHGNGPQVGLLALQASAYDAVEPYPLDVLGASSIGQIGYMLEQQIGNLLPSEQRFATLLTQVEVDPNDPAFETPTKFIGPVYSKEVADALAAEKGYVFKQDGEYFRRVVASPLPKRIIEVEVIKKLIDWGTLVICAGGGGIPTAFASDGTLQGVEAVIDKDRAAALLAREVGADALLILTDVDAAYVGWGTDDVQAIRQIAPNALAGYDFPAGSMGPKVEAAAEFARATGNIACIGNLEQAVDMLAGKAGTTVSSRCEQTVLV